VGHTSARLGELARLVEGELDGPADKVVVGPATLDEAGANHITFAAEARYVAKVNASKAGAVIVGRDVEKLEVPTIRVQNPRLAWCQVLEHFAPARPEREGVHPSAVVGMDVKIGKGVWIGPHAVVGDRCRLGDRVVLDEHVVVGDDVLIGKGAHLYPHVTVYARTEIGRNVTIHAGSVLGCDGFGYVSVGKKHRKIPHIGNVVIGDDVEIGALVSVDRGVCGSTVIGRGSKVDNLVQIGHNVRVGEDCIIVAQTGVAGSAVLGDRVTLAGQSGVVGHLKVGSDTVLAARGVIARDTPAGSFVSGFPARPHRESMRVIAYMQKLPQMNETVATLQREIRELQDRLQRLEEERPATGEAR